MCALAEGNLIPGASSQFEAGLPNYAGRDDGRGVDHGSPAELSRATRLSLPARPVSDNVTSLLFYTRYRGTPSKLPKSKKVSRTSQQCYSLPKHCVLTQSGERLGPVLVRELLPAAARCKFLKITPCDSHTAVAARAWREGHSSRLLPAQPGSSPWRLRPPTWSAPGLQLRRHGMPE